MWRNYLTIALRLLARNRVYAAINIGGLALGLAGCLLIFNYVRYERAYDSWLPDAGRVFQVQTTLKEPGQPVIRTQYSPYPVREMLPAGFPQIEAISVVQFGPALLQRDDVPYFVDTAAVDPSFFEIFQLPFLHGSPASALRDPGTIVLTESEAIRDFGTSDVLGRMLSMGAGPGKRDHRVTGVLRDLPRNSNLRFSILFPYDRAGHDQAPEQFRGWGWRDQQHFVKLRAGADVRAINAALPGWEKRVIPPAASGGATASRGDWIDLSLVPVADIHLGAAQQDAWTPGGDPRALASLSIVALLTLGMALMNFVNLSTARATQRAREVALRKLFGASRGQLVGQLLGEAMLSVSLALLLALAMVELATPWIGAWIGVDLTAHYLGDGGLLVPALALLLIAGVGGGLYPALYLSRFRPAAVLRANQSAAETPGSGRLRTALVVLQFATAIGLVTCAGVIWAQTRFVQTVDPGYRRDGLVQVNQAWRFAGNSAEYAAAHRDLLAIPGVVATGRTNLGLAADNRNTPLVQSPAGATQSIGFYGVDDGFFGTMDLRLLAGRVLDERHADRILRGSGSDEAFITLVPEQAARGVNLVANRSAARQFGFDPADAVGKLIRVGISGGKLVPATIVGVVEDTRVRTARDPAEAMLYGYDPDYTNQVLVRYAGARPADVMAGINRVWRKYEPELPFDGQFSEDVVARLYRGERIQAALFTGFSMLTGLIACLGLYSLASFATERRTREIGIRKVLGAKVRDIVRLLAWQFSKPVVLANLVAWPVAWWAMRDWLNTFDLRIPLTPGPFILAGLLALAIAIATVAGQSLRVARTNPIHALRYE